MSSMKSMSNSAYAVIRGGSEYPQIRGRAIFKQQPNGVLVTVRVMGLPDINDEMGIFAFHIHSGNCCTGNSRDEFSDAKTHYNPENIPHPFHAGDLPPLFGNNGFAYMQVLTYRFTVNEIIGRTIIIHKGVDDFTSQPAGNAGEKIACGVIMRG